jgi:cell division protein ZapE
MNDVQRKDLQQIYLQQLAERGFQSDPAQLAAVRELDDLRSRLLTARDRSGPKWLSRLRLSSNQAPVRGLYLWGGVGRGKTWLMDMFFHSLPFGERKRRHFHRFMYDIHAELKTLGQRVAPLEYVADRIAADTRVLCFDELAVTDIADAMLLGGLFDAMFRRGITLVATSNMPPQDLYKGGLQRQRFLPAIQLLERHTKVVHVDGGTDYRLRQLTQAGTFLSSDAPDTPKRLEALFMEIADGGGHRGGAIEIDGRTIPVVRADDNVIWFEFDAICEGPRSQNDYIEIARDYQCVIVSNVPVLDATRDDAARRFIALVDELYDRNVNLILSAAAPPNALYTGERLSFPFQRTASRLAEMQSEQYLTREHRP